MDCELDLPLEECEPNEWFVVFHRDSPRRWVKWLSMGRYCHVSAFGEVRKAGIWLFFDVLVDRSRIRAVPDSRADRLLGHLSNVGKIVRMPPERIASDRLRFKPGFWCVPAVAHLVGLNTCALRPDALLRHCLAHGGTIVVDDDHGFQHSGRP